MRTARRVRRLERRDLVLVLERESDVVEAVQQAVALERVELERDLATRRVDDRLLLEVDRQRPRRRRPSPSARAPRRAGATIGTRPILTQFVAKMSPNDGATTTSKP